MAKRKRFTLKQLGTGVSPKISGELSELAWALNRPIADMIREMIENDLPLFKDRHRQAIRDENPPNPRKPLIAWICRLSDLTDTDGEFSEHNFVTLTKGD